MTHHPFYSFEWKHAIALFLLVFDRLRRKEILKLWDVVIEDNWGGKKLLKYRWFVPSFVDNAFNQPNWSFSFPFFLQHDAGCCWLVSLLLKKHFRESNQSLFFFEVDECFQVTTVAKSHWVSLKGLKSYVTSTVLWKFFLSNKLEVSYQKPFLSRNLT